MDSALEAASVVPGIFSETARATEFEIAQLRARCDTDEPEDDTSPSVIASSKGAKAKSARLVQETSCDRLVKTAGQHRIEAVMQAKAAAALAEQDQEKKAKGKAVPQGDLARAIQEKLGQKLTDTNTAAAGGTQGGGAAGTAADKKVTFSTPAPTAKASEGKAASTATAPRPTRCFSSPEFFEGPWTSKHTASKSPGPLNRWNEQRPDIAYYRLQYGAVLERQPSADFSEKPKHKPRSRERSVHGSAHGSPSGSDAAGTFSLTGIDEEDDSPRTRSAKRLQQQEELYLGRENDSGGYLAKTPNWDEFGEMRVGRFLNVHYNRHSEPATDFIKQDIKGFPKQRYPEWDFAAPLGRKDLMDADAISAPGKYDVDFSAVRGKVLSGVPWGKGLTHSQSDGQLGHFALQGVLHKDEKRFPGGVIMNRSSAKDSVRDRIRLVNDFKTELARPNLPPASQEYHDKDDRSACEITLRRQMTFDADAADVYVTHRRDMAPSYKRMLPRSKSSVQGVRALQKDLGVRGAVGLGFFETTGQRQQPVEKLEGRSSNAAYERPDIGPNFSQQTQFRPLCMENNFNHGHSPVVGAGPLYEQKHAPLQKAKVETQFKRQIDSGFTHRSPLKGLKVPNESRTYEAVADWSASLATISKQAKRL
eukprot:TRINITY_DN60912_c0_g1_i1.p1 TRINITY_DN60912_c0_g1~~TRINITY_DN60912_c0_g1_i1.p1  ORF type:complete len:648 (+),score=142.55 TRINITY_DN60912_c0_g1_i1:92-2035(+)